MVDSLNGATKDVSLTPRPFVTYFCVARWRIVVILTGWSDIGPFSRLRALSLHNALVCIDECACATAHRSSNGRAVHAKLPYR